MFSSQCLKEEVLFGSKRQAQFEKLQHSARLFATAVMIPKPS